MLNEVLDECEKLPMDKSLSVLEKLDVIRSYAQDELVQKRGDEAVLPYLDYRIIWFFLKRLKQSKVLPSIVAIRSQK